MVDARFGFLVAARSRRGLYPFDSSWWLKQRGEVSTMPEECDTQKYQHRKQQIRLDRVRQEPYPRAHEQGQDVFHGQ